MGVIGDRIKNLRIENGMTQEELGSILGVKKSAIQKYESGAVVNLSADKIKKLCAVFNVFPRYFIFESDDEFLETIFDADNRYIHRMPDMEGTALIEERFGMSLLRLMVSVAELNNQGQRKVVDYISDIKKIEEYRSHGRE